MLDKLNELKERATKSLEQIKDLKALQDLKVKYLGKKGEITQISRKMSDVSAEERPKIGKAVNQMKNTVKNMIEAKVAELEKIDLERSLEIEKIDVTLPAREIPLGNRHPIDQIIDEVEDIFIGMGYKVVEGPQVELDYYNFERLNMPPDHPAREMQDSFYISDEVVLRTHTSPVQARAMDDMYPEVPVKVICPGAVYRRDDDATHTPMFHQIEGLIVDEGITMGDLQGTLLSFLRKMFGEERKIRLRPSYFPFTEPSSEVDISCMVCNGKGCKLCKNTGWIEILGSGMVHPNVLEKSGYDSEKLTGFAFGMGIERIAMLKYGIEDMRLLFENDVRFLSQF